MHFNVQLPGSNTHPAVPNHLEVNMKRFVFSLLLLSFSTAFVTACHTVEGVGKDVKEVGEEVEETAQGK